MTRSIGILALIAVSAAAQDAAFDVATIRPHNPAKPGFGIVIQGRRLNTVGTTLSNLIGFAYFVHPRQIVNAPPWIASDKYDIVAEVLGEEKASNQQLMIARAQTLLADRFGLAFHRESKMLPVYEIVVGKTGPQFLGNAGDPNGNPGYGFGGLGLMDVKNATIANFAGWLQRYVLDRPVVDHTGIEGKFNFVLTWKADEFQFADIASALPRAANDADRSDLYTAIQQQLGLKLQTTRAPVDVLVIDRVERPSAN
jgi:uncharacterized protein (TIGR03435 family)